MDHATEVPEAARVITMALSLVTISILSFCLTRRIQFLIKNKSWKTLPFTSMLILSIYIDSYIFIFCTAILSKAYSLNQSGGICDGAILLCLACYMTTKILIYYFLVEKVYIIRSNNTPRMKSKLWLFNFFGVICPFIVLVVLNFVYRIAYLDENGVCIIGMERPVLIPLITCDLLLNIWLTSLFLAPLRKCYSFKQQKSSRLRTMVVRTFVGSCVTLALSITNLSVLTILDGEPGFICLCLCNLDILFSTCVLHWATSVDNEESNSTTSHSARRTGLMSSTVVSTVGNAKQSSYMELDERISKTTTVEIGTVEVGLDGRPVDGGPLGHLV